MRVLGLTIERTKAAAMAPPSSASPIWSRGGGSGWWPVVREASVGAWQRNETITADTALAFPAVFACVTLIAADIGKLCLRLVQQDAAGIWVETESAAISPVLRKPNRYQTRHKFFEQWIVSKLLHGNAYVLKERDARGVVVALYVLDPTRVTPLVATDGSVWYSLKRDDLAGVVEGQTPIVPAREIIHDPMVALFHPLLGVSPIFAAGVAAMQGLNIQSTSESFFKNRANPSGMLTAPGRISDETVGRLLETIAAKAPGAPLVGGDGLKYEQFTMSSVDAQLIEQLKWTGETVCACFHVPPHLVGVAPLPPDASAGMMVQQYYASCLQSLMTNLETSLDEGLELPKPYGTEFNPDDLIWLDSATKTKAAADGIGSAAMAPDEARARYFGLGPVPGGNSPYLQQQYYSLAALAARDADQPFAKATPATPPSPPVTPPVVDDATLAASYAIAVRRRSIEAGFYAA